MGIGLTIRAVRNSAFRFPHSAFRTFFLPPPAFRIPHVSKVFRLQHSAFRNFECSSAFRIPHSVSSQSFAIPQRILPLEVFMRFKHHDHFIQVHLSIGTAFGLFENSLFAWIFLCGGEKFIDFCSAFRLPHSAIFKVLPHSAFRLPRISKFFRIPHSAF